MSRRTNPEWARPPRLTGGLEELNDPELFEDLLSIEDEIRRTPDRPVETERFDVMATYKSFRQNSEWGINVFRQQRHELARTLMRFKMSPSAAYESSAQVLVLHELSHFLVDRAILQLEKLLEDSHAAKFELWTSYQHSHKPWSEREEAYCNSFAIKFSTKSARSALIRFMRLQPPGYRDFDNKQIYGTKRRKELILDYLQNQDVSDYELDKVWKTIEWGYKRDLAKATVAFPDDQTLQLPLRYV